MTAPAASAADYLTLDASAAFRADEAAQRLPRPAAEPGDGRAVVPNDVPAPAAGVWLLLVTALERAAQLDARHRAGHFRRARVVWEEAATVLADPRYAQIGGRLGRWRASDPTLPVVKELLWALEQPEAAGYTRLALAGYAALARLVPADAARRGYVLAQSARALRTLGDVEGARERYATSERLGVRHRDRWLRVRSAIGLGATYHQLGNHPAAREVYARVLAAGSPDVRFTAAAYHGLLLSANAAGDHEAALTHGLYLLQASRDGVVPRVDAWLLLAGVCYRIGRHNAATHLAKAALRIATRPDDATVALQILVTVATATANRALGARYAPALRDSVHRGAGAYDDVRSLLALASFHHASGNGAAARADLDRARKLASTHDYHELVFRADTLEAAWARRQASVGAADDQPEPVPLTAQAIRVVRRLSTWNFAIEPRTLDVATVEDVHEHAAGG